MKIKKTKKILHWVLISILLPSIFLFSGCLKEKKKDYALNLEIWGVFDDSDVFHEINQQYRELNPQVKKIKYRKISNNISEYEKTLTNAIASGNGPDILFFSNNWLAKHKDKISPLPDSEQFSSSFKNNFVDVIEKDFIDDNQIYAMPLYCDTLALFYNKSLFNQAGVTSPPETWKELLDHVDYLTRKDSNGNILQSAIALGRSKNPGGINRSSDILALLMMQNGVNIYDKKTQRVAFDNDLKAVDVLNFYTQFALAGSKAYNWNSNMDYSIDSFRSGKTAMMLNYSYWKNKLKKESPKLNFETAPVPQQNLNQKVNLAKYWGLAVVKNKELQPVASNQPINYTQKNRIDEAWDYIKYLTTKPVVKEDGSALEFDPTKKYLENTNKPSARKDLIEEQKGNSYLDEFAIQTLTAKSWGQSKNLIMEEVFVEMIDEVVSGTKTSQEALNSGAYRINNLINK